MVRRCQPHPLKSRTIGPANSLALRGRLDGSNSNARATISFDSCESGNSDPSRISKTRLGKSNATFGKRCDSRTPPSISINTFAKLNTSLEGSA